MAHFGAGLFGCEHPFDASPGGIALLLPGRGLGGQLFDTVDAAIKALGRQHADLDLHHVQPTGMLGDIVEFQSAQHPSGLLSRERLVERAGRVDRQIVENDTDTLGLGKVNVSKFAHAGGEIDCGPALGDFTLRQGRWTSTNTNRLAVPLRRYSQS